MKFQCKAADISFLESAPIKLSYSIRISSDAKTVYDALINPNTWPHWFPGMTSATALLEEAECLSRIVTLNYFILFREEFLITQPNQKVAYRVSAVSIPYADELVEEFSIQQMEKEVEVKYRIGLRVHRSLSLLSGLVERIGARSYQAALNNLKTFIEK